ncbi:MAG: homoserine dehydrogenase [Candidatus Omnitrophota bacterium]
MRKINIGLLGFGNVGSGLVRIIRERKCLLAGKVGAELVIKRICDKDLKSPRGIRLSPGILTSNTKELLRDKELEVIVELIGGVHPAKEFIVEALHNGKHVVTANKAVLAEEGEEIFKAAEKSRRNVYFEASVGAGVPIIKTIREGLIANKFNAVYGIINGTSNFVLSKMAEEGSTFKAALREAQERGFAERNPALDINGFDSAHKLIILIYLAFGRLISIKNIFVEGIADISSADVKFANEMNLRIKLLAIAKRSANALEVRVHPTLIAKSHPLASVSGIYNAIYLEADLAGDILIYGQGAGKFSAASAVASDLADLASDILLKGGIQRKLLPSHIPARRLKRIDEIETRFYIRFMAIDKPGVLARIAGVLGKYGISISSVSQKERKYASAVPVVMLTHEAKERNMRLALEKIYQMAVIREKPVAIRMENL